MQALKIFGVLLASSILQGNEALRGHSFLELEEKHPSSANINYARKEYGEKSEVENGNKTVFVLNITLLEPIKKISLSIDLNYVNMLF